MRAVEALAETVSMVRQPSDHAASDSHSYVPVRVMHPCGPVLEEQMTANPTLERANRTQQEPGSAGLSSVSRDELKAMVDRGDGFTLVETLAPEQFHDAHLPGAINIPPDRVSELAPSVLPDKRVEVITYCAGPTCHASADAARELMKLGYTHVRHYAGGKADWMFAGLPVERSEHQPPPYR